MGVITNSMTINDFYDAHDISNNFLTFCGLSYVERVRTSVSGQYRFSFKKLCYGFLIALLILFVFYQQMTIFYPKGLDNVVLLLLYLYIVVIGSLMAMLMVTTALFIAPKLSDILNNPEFFELFTIEDSFRVVKMNSLQQILFSFCVLFCCYIADLAAEPEITPLAAVKIMWFFFFPMYNAFCLTQFFITHYWLQRLYWNINESLSRLLDGKWLVHHEMFMFGILEMGRFYPNCKPKVYNVHPAANDVNVITNDNYAAEIAISAELIRLRRIYHKVHKVTQLINQAFSTRNILLLIHHCALETIYTYWGLRHVLENLDVSLTAKLNFFKAAFMSFVSVVSMVWPCTTTRIEAERTVQFVQELLSSVKTSESRLELEIFALLLLQHPYSISPYGFFDMNNQLILGFLGAMASYLVILLQYHMVNTALEANRNSHIANETIY